MRKWMGIARRDEHGAALARSGQPFRYCALALLGRRPHKRPPSLVNAGVRETCTFAVIGPEQSLASSPAA